MVVGGEIVVVVEIGGAEIDAGAALQRGEEGGGHVGADARQHRHAVVILHPRESFDRKKRLSLWGAQNEESLSCDVTKQKESFFFFLIDHFIIINLNEIEENQELIKRFET